MNTSRNSMPSKACWQVKATLTCSALAIAMATSATASAQTAPVTAPTTAEVQDNTKLEDVVVTARKRAESIDTVPLSITAMSSAKIEERNLKSLEDVAAFTPGFYTQQNTGTGTGRNDRSFRQLTFRGIGANSTNVGPLAGGVAFLDGSPVLNSSLSNVQDLERVEVLKGPQSVYFGRSTFIGAVNYITKDPSKTWTVRLTGEYGQDNLYDVSGSISGPLTDWAAIRISARHFSKGGQYQTANSATKLGGQQTDSVSGSLLLTPTDNLKMRTFYNYFIDSDGPPAQYTLGGVKTGYGASNCNLGGTFGAYYCGQVPQKADPALISANLGVTPVIYQGLLQNTKGYPAPFNFADFLSAYGLKRKANQFSNRIDYTIGENGPTLTSVTAFHNERIVTLSDFTFRATPYIVSTAVGYRDYDWSQELRLVSTQNSRLRWVAGGNYIKLNQTSSGIIGDFAGSILNFGAPAIGYTRAETPSVFAGVYFDIVPKLTLTLEGRYQWDKISGHFAQTATTFGDLSQTFKSFSPRVSLDYKLTPVSTVYALFSRGYKPGGFNQPLITYQNQPFYLNQFASAGASPVYGQERLDNFETGIKGSFLDGRLRASLDGYIGRYRNAQIPIPITFAVQNTNPQAFNSILLVRNVGAVNLKGVEFEAEAIVVPGLRLGGTFAYTDTTIKSYYCQECSSILAQNSTNTIQSTAAIDKRLPGAPKFAYTLSANYENKVGDQATAYIGADYLYRGTYYADAANIASSGTSKTVNARLGLRVAKYSIELFARNLFDNQSPSISYYPGDYFNSITASGNSLRLGLPDRRRIGVRLNAGF